MPAGTPVPETAFPGISCTSTSCTCAAACNFPNAMDNGAFTNLVDRMNDIMPGIAAGNVVVDYRHSGLGFAGDRNGPAVPPLISVRLQNMPLVPNTLLLFGGSVHLPEFCYSLTMKDGQRHWANQMDTTGRKTV